MAARILVSAGEASGDLYAAQLVEALRRRNPSLQFFGCAGPRMRAAGVQAVLDSSSLAVAGLFEVVRHIPRIYSQYRKLVQAVRDSRPDAAILTDSPDFHLRLARKLHKLGVPVIYLIAPQVWAWRKGRLPSMRRVLKRLLCIFPFEKQFFDSYNIPTTYIGHPLTRILKVSAQTSELRKRYAFVEESPLIVLLPGSRRGELIRHLPHLLDAVDRVRASRRVQFALSLPLDFAARDGLQQFAERFRLASIQVFEGETWDLLACSDLALAASGTVTVEAALLGAPLVTFYRVTTLSWLLGKLLVRVPHYSMVNLLAGRRVAPELMQRDMTGAKLAEETLRLLDSPESREEMRAEWRLLAEKLSGAGDPMETAASVIEEIMGTGQKGGRREAVA